MIFHIIDSDNSFSVDCQLLKLIKMLHQSITMQAQWLKTGKLTDTMPASRREKQRCILSTPTIFLCQWYCSSWIWLSPLARKPSSFLPYANDAIILSVSEIGLHPPCTSLLPPIWNIGIHGVTRKVYPEAIAGRRKKLCGQFLGSTAVLWPALISSLLPGPNTTHGCVLAHWHMYS